MTLIKRTWMVFAVLALFFLPVERVLAQAEDGAQLVDSIEEFQQRIDGLVRERLSSLVPSNAFVLRIFVMGKPVKIPVASAGADVVTGELPGFKRGGKIKIKRTIEKFQIDQVSVRVMINADLTPEDVEYVRTIVPLLAELRPDRGDSLDIRVVPPKKKKRAFGAEEEEKSLWEQLDIRDLILTSLLALILLVLLVLMFRVLFLPKEKMAPPPRRRPAYQPEPEPYQPQQPQQPPPMQQHQAPMQQPQQPMSQAAQGIMQGAPVGSPADQEALATQAQLTELEQLKHSVVKNLFSRPDLGKELITSWADKAEKMKGLITALGPAIGRQAMLPHVNREKYQQYEEAVFIGQPATIADQVALLKEAQLFLLAQDLLHPESSKPNPFAFLDHLTFGQVGHLLKSEPMNVKALILSRMKPEDSARVVAPLSSEEQLELAVHMGNLSNMPLDMAEGVAFDLAKKARDVPDARIVDIHGPHALADVMSETPAEVSRYLLKAMRAKDAKLSEKVDKRFFVFDAITLVPQDVLPQAVRSVPSNIVTQALQGADPELARRVIMAFPEQARSGMVNSVRAAQFDEETIQEARRQLVRRFQVLGDQGKIDLKQITDVWQSQSESDAQAEAS